MSNFFTSLLCSSDCVTEQIVAYTKLSVEDYIAIHLPKLISRISESEYKTQVRFNLVALINADEYVVVDSHLRDDATMVQLIIKYTDFICALHHHLHKPFVVINNGKYTNIVFILGMPNNN